MTRGGNDLRYTDEDENITKTPSFKRVLLDWVQLR